jgi:AraC family transcriptional regulator
MEDTIEQAVKRAITTMRENLGEQLTVDDMARAAMFSKFHFTRVFQRVTGVSPGRFLSALRLQRAKQLLVSTSLNVADISLRVGYNSVGTFSSRFSRSVGMSPTTYRRLAGYAHSIQTQAHHSDPAVPKSRVYGQIWPSHGQPRGLVFVGLFPERIPEGRPVRCATLPGPGSYQFDDVPPGTWYLLAQSVSGDPVQPAPDADGTDQTISVATDGPLTIRRDASIRADVVLKPARALDPPVLLALMDARKLAMARATGGDGAAAIASGRLVGPARPTSRTAA